MFGAGVRYKCSIRPYQRLCEATFRTFIDSALFFCLINCILFENFDFTTELAAFFWAYTFQVDERNQPR